MDAFQTAQRFNRRTFLARSGLNLGAMALGSLLSRDQARAASGGLPGLPHFAPKAKRVIYLFQSGAPSQMDLFDPKPTLADKRGIDLPSSIRMGQRITTMTTGQKTLPVAPSLFKFAAARQVRNLAERTAAAHGESRRRIVRHPVDADGSDQPRPGHHLRSDRLAAGRPAVRSALGGVRPRQHQPGSAGVRGPCVAWHRQPERPAALRPLVGQRLFAHPLPGREAPRRQGTGTVLGRPGGLQPRHPPGRCSTTSAN